MSVVDTRPTTIFSLIEQVSFEASQTRRRLAFIRGELVGWNDSDKETPTGDYQGPIVGKAVNDLGDILNELGRINADLDTLKYTLGVDTGEVQTSEPKSIQPRHSIGHL